MKAKYKLICSIVLVLALIAAMLVWLFSTEVAIFHPAGDIARRQRDLIVFTILLSLVVIIPVFFMTIMFAWRYREGNKKANYKPNWDHNHMAEAIWWGIPIIIIIVLAIVTWKTSHSLDPYKPLDSDKKPLTVQVISQDWKWLFIYPDQGIATVNHLRIPEKTPINFLITSDSAMNSFWIPRLGGQVYAMAGMQTKLHLIANKTGIYEGVAANITGEGFAGMKFKTTAVSENEFEKWVKEAKTSDKILDNISYIELAKPTKNHPPETYVLADRSVYDTVIMKYMTPADKRNKGREN